MESHYHMIKMEQEGQSKMLTTYITDSCIIMRVGLYLKNF